MIFCGIRESVVNSLLASLNLPTVSPTTLKKGKRNRIGTLYLNQLQMRSATKHLPLNEEGELFIMLTILVHV